MSRKIFICFSILFMFATVAIAGEKEEVLESVKDYKNNSSEEPDNEFDNLRPKAIKEAAETLAFQRAVKFRYEEIVELLKKKEKHLDNIFNFKMLMLNKGKVVPPVIVEARKGYNILSDREATEVNRTYKILKDARIASAPPNWRDYLVKEYGSQEEVNPAVLPKNEKEERLWDAAAERGFNDGIKHADRLFEINLNTLRRDFEGILKFKILAEQNMVDVPVFSEGELGVRVDDKVLDIDQKVFRITEDSRFKEMDKWEPKLGE